MARLGSHWGTLKAQLELSGIILVPWGMVLAAPGLHFESPGALQGHFFFDLATILSKI